MPIYELACSDCGHQYERIVSFSSITFPACPACGCAAVTRLLSKPAIHFKGSGWYINDSKTEDEKKKKAVAQKENGSDASSDKSTESESKSETKAEEKNGSEGKSEGKSESKSQGESASAAKEEG